MQVCQGSNPCSSAIINKTAPLDWTKKYDLKGAFIMKTMLEGNDFITILFIDEKELIHSINLLAILQQLYKKTISAVLQCIR